VEKMWDIMEDMVSGKIIAEAMKRNKRNLTPAEAEKLETISGDMFTAVQVAVRSSPLVQRFYRESLEYAERHGSGSPRIIAPWQAQAERQMHVWAMTQPQTTLSPDVIYAMGKRGMKSDNPIRMALILQMQSAQVYLLRKEIIRLLNKMPIPRHVIGPNIMPYPLMYITPEYSLSVATSSEEEQSPLDCDYMLLQASPEGVNVTMPSAQRVNPALEDVRQTINCVGIEFNKVWPDDFEKPDSVRFILAILAFLNSPFVASEPTKITRNVRRQFKREGWNDPNLLTNVVTLRRSVHNGSNSGNTEPLERHNRWWVSGHIRAQWYPSLKAHKLIWIAPHIKGPEDKPVKKKTYVVVR